MKQKKYSNQQLIDAIVEKFGSIEAFADLQKVDRTNIYQRIDRQTAKFLKELRDSGVNIDSIKQSNGDIQIAGVSGSKINVNPKDLQHEVESLKKEIQLLRETIKSKDDQITLLRELLGKERGS